MADIEQSVTWKFRLDLSELSEAEKRVAALKQQVKEVERGAGGTTDTITQTNQRMRARDAETASIERNTRAIDANAAAQRRAGMGGVGPGGGGISPAIVPTNTGMMHGPAYEFRGGAIPYAETVARRAWMGNLQRGILERYARGGGSPVGPANNPVYDAMAARASANPAGVGVGHVPMWASPARDTFNPAWMTQQLRHPATRLGTTGGGLRYMMTPPGQPSYLPGGFGDPRGRLDVASGFHGISTTGYASPAAIAYANQQAQRRAWFPNTFAGGFGVNRGMYAFSHLGNAAASAALTFDPNLAPGTRVATGLNTAISLGGAYYSAGGAQGVRAFAGSTLGRASMAALPVYLGLEGARRYYQGEADYQAQIGSQLDYRINVNNLQRQQRMGLAELRRNEQRDLGAFRDDFRMMQFQRLPSVMREGASFDQMRAATYGDPVERIEVLKQQRDRAVARQLSIRNKLEQEQKVLAGAKNDAAKELANRRIQGFQGQLSAVAEQRYGIQGEIGSELLGLSGARDAIQRRLDSYVGFQRAGRSFRRDQAALEEIESQLAATGFGDLSTSEIQRRLGVSQRRTIDQIEGGARGARFAGDRADMLQGHREIADKYETASDKLVETIERLIKALEKPPEPERSGVNAAVNGARDAIAGNPAARTALGFAIPGGSLAVDYLFRGE